MAERNNLRTEILPGNKFGSLYFCCDRFGECQSWAEQAGGSRVITSLTQLPGDAKADGDGCFARRFSGDDLSNFNSLPRLGST